VLYNNGIVHRDIKPENILIHNGDFKIADFGLSKKVEDMEIIANMSAKGTPLYMAPEIHVEKEGSSKVDVFSLGVVLYKMAFNGQYPFFDQNRKYRSVNEYFKELLVRKLVIPAQHKRSPVLVSLIEKMLIKDKEKRISWKEIFEMEEIKNAIRFERKKELAPMDELNRSLMIVNKSQTQVHLVREPQGQGESNESDECSIIL
jgi:serine/threonine-protein kinase ULK/ATG1